MELRPEEITKIIREQIKHYENRMESSQTGIVILVGDGIAKVSGLDMCMAGELVELSNGSFGMAQNLEEDTVAIVILGSDNGIREGDTVKRTGRVVSVPVGENRFRTDVYAAEGEGLIRWLMQFSAEDLKVLAPESIIDAIKERAEEICSFYK